MKILMEVSQEESKLQETPDGTAIRFDSDYFGTHRGVDVIPGPFADAKEAVKKLY